MSYGIWNGMTKRFIFGIKANTPQDAREIFRKLNPGGFRCWRYEVKKIPAGWKNPPNEMWQRIMNSRQSRRQGKQ